MSARRIQAQVQLAIKKVPPLFYALKWSRDAFRSAFGPGQISRRVRRVAACGEPLRVIIGAGLVDCDETWIPTNEQALDLLNESDWRRAFGEHRLDALLAEHVWEHLTPADGKKAAAQCWSYLKPGGRLRIAVPDGNHPDPAYYEMVRPGGYRSSIDDHKILYTYETLSDMLRDVGFEVDLLEYFDANKVFHRNEWKQSDGYILRCHGYTESLLPGTNNYTSLIVDGRKPVKL